MVAGLFFLTIWEAWVRIAQVPSWILPAPTAILTALYTGLPMMALHIRVTLGTALAGLILAVVLSFALVFLMERIPILRQAFYPFIVVSQTIPIIYILPLLMIWFGTGIHPKILIVVLVCFFPMVINLMDGMAKIDPELIDLFRSMGASPRKTLWMVKLPGALPYFFSGLKVAATYSMMGAVIAEWVGAQHGMGIYMMRAYKTFSTTRVFAAILVLVMLSLVLFQGVVKLQRILVPWHQKENK